MIAVQAEGCAPVVRAFEENEPRSRFFENAHTVAAGLRVPKPLGDFLVLEAVRASGGTAIAVTDDEMLDAGIHWPPRRASTPLRKARPAWPRSQNCWPRASSSRADRIVHLQHRLRPEVSRSLLHALPARPPAGEQDKLGGLITPR